MPRTPGKQEPIKRPSSPLPPSSHKTPSELGLFFVVLYRNFRSLPFLGLLGFLNKAAKSLIYSYPPECSQVLGVSQPKALQAQDCQREAHKPELSPVLFCPREVTMSFKGSEVRAVGLSFVVYVYGAYNQKAHGTPQRFCSKEFRQARSALDPSFQFPGEFDS